jgi:hypothetical protein
MHAKVYETNSNNHSNTPPPHPCPQNIPLTLGYSNTIAYSLSKLPTFYSGSFTCSNSEKQNDSTLSSVIGRRYLQQAIPSCFVQRVRPVPYFKGYRVKPLSIYLFSANLLEHKSQEMSPQPNEQSTGDNQINIESANKTCTTKCKTTTETLKNGPCGIRVILGLIKISYN